MKRSSIILQLVATLFAFSCKKNVNSIREGNDPNFKIVANDDGVLKKYNRKVDVFGVKIFAVSGVTDVNLLHSANLMAQYLDNNEDGIPDNQAVLDKLVEKKAYMVLWKNQRDLLVNQPNGWEGQDLGNDETHPTFVIEGKTGTFDAALEEVLHLITHVGYAGVYPDVFGEMQGSQIADAMDIARGGQFLDIPKDYPSNAWYSYNDKTCKYDCMVTEYHYWALTSILGAQENRLTEIQQEWKLNTRTLIEQKDSLVFQLLTDPQYQFPTILPDGTYKH